MLKLLAANNFMPAPVKIGLLGGIGPESSARFYERMILELQRRGCITKNQDYPQILINSIPASEFPPEPFHASSIEDIDPLYVKGLRELDQLSPDFVAVICNSAHAFFAELQRTCTSPLVNLPQEVHSELLRKGARRTVILGTPWTIKTGLYSFSDVQPILMEDQDLQILYRSIYAFNVGSEPRILKRSLVDLANKYLDRGADTVVLGCTEVSLLLESEPLPKVDTYSVLLEAVIKKFCALRERALNDGTRTVSFGESIVRRKYRENQDSSQSDEDGLAHRQERTVEHEAQQQVGRADLSSFLLVKSLIGYVYNGVDKQGTQSGRGSSHQERIEASKYEGPKRRHKHGRNKRREGSNVRS